MDNFPSFTELGQLPNWYEGEDAGRARCVELQEGDGTKTGENKGVCGSFTLQLSCILDPGLQSQGTNPQKTGKN